MEICRPTECRAYSKDFLIIHTWRAREREPITGVWGGASRETEPPEGCPGGSPRWRARGEAQADEVFVFKPVIFNGFPAVLHKMMYNLYF